MYGYLTYIVLNHCTYKNLKWKKKKKLTQSYVSTQSGPRIHCVANDTIELLMPLSL